MIYNGVILSKEEVKLLTELFGKIVYQKDKELFKWMHSVGLGSLFDEMRQTLKDPMDDHIECYHDED